MSVFAGMACAQEVERVAAAGTTATGAGWRASLFVTRPEVKDDAFPLGGSSTVGARLSRSISKHARVSGPELVARSEPVRPGALLGEAAMLAAR